MAQRPMPQQSKPPVQGSQPAGGIPNEGFPGEAKLKLRAKGYLTIEGKVFRPGEEFELPERQALELVGSQQAEQIPTR